MKILQIYKTYTPDTFGGIEQVIKALYLETSKLGATHTLLTTSKHPRQDAIDGLPIVRLKNTIELASCPFSLQFFRKFKSIAEAHDLLHFHYPWPFADFTQVVRSVDRPALVTFHADALKHPLLHKLYGPFQTAFLRQVERIVPTSLPLLETSKTLAPFRDKCTVIPLGIDPASYPKVSKNSLQHWKAKLGQGFVLFVGVLRHYKGLTTLLEAASYLNLPVVIAGTGPLQTELQALVLQKHLKQVHLLGSVSEEDKIALYSLCQMVVLPSHSRAEAFGVSLLEGLMHRKPLISTELGTGTSYVNQHGKTGLVIPPNDPPALADAITQLHANPVLAQIMGDTGHTWFLEHFQSAIMGQRYFQLYQQLTH